MLDEIDFHLYNVLLKSCYIYIYIYIYICVCVCVCALSFILSTI